ncbi:tRNA 2-thiouridine synthesizing protein A [Methylomarinovum tepidoasis]|uniref:tRNA 2-thiouridine synthesizing protein A n=1 Tax=Methylomarinovum tepidoasis TaxID=2840183 RepID=A0AAU9CVB2_9GAMM|nr:sulfurtransferase TusA family protein [Methylomarinovum sp. IN45]BCX88034.1 tRNA 2-thiouridine synthesizing protein A [Methylomarinovum sp. IN45]
MSRESIDARGLLCPLPVIRLQEAVRDFPPGTEVEVIGTDPGVLHDIPAWCRVHGHRVVKTEKGRDEYRIVLIVGEQ